MVERMFAIVDDTSCGVRQAAHVITGLRLRTITGKNRAPEPFVRRGVVPP